MSLAVGIAAAAPDPPVPAIPWSEVGARAGAQYQGDGIFVSATESGVRLRCAFQKLEGDVSSAGLWLVSTEVSGKNDRFQVIARTVGRSDGEVRPAISGVTSLTRTGTVAVADERARFMRSGLIEEYSVSVDGVRQDFLVLAPPAGTGALRVELDVTGARAEAASWGARLVLAGSGRAIAYSRLHAADANGRALEAHIEVSASTRLAVLVDDADAVYPVRIDPTFADVQWSALGTGVGDQVHAVAVIGSTVFVGGVFTSAAGVNANRIAKWNGSAWSTLRTGVDNGVSNHVVTFAVDGTDLYVGFTDFDPPGHGFRPTGNIAKWDSVAGAWSDLGTGTNSHVRALLVHGRTLYVGGTFNIAGDTPAGRIAQWDLDGPDTNVSWTNVGTAIPGSLTSERFVRALAWSDDPAPTLYAAGSFTGGNGNPGPTFVGQVAKWDPGTGVWSPLGSGSGVGVGTEVRALAVYGQNLYVGGSFSTAGGHPANNLAKWALGGTTDNDWSSMPVELNGNVHALAVFGADLYVGGGFTAAGSTTANHIAKWNGSTWSSLGAGVNNGVDGTVRALAMTDTGIYVGGIHTVAGTVSANRIAKWSGVAPGTVATLILGLQGNGGVMLTWSPSCEPTDNDYEIYAGTVLYNHQQVLCTTSGATSVTLPPDNESFIYYIVVPRNSFNKEGSYGKNGSTGLQRPRASSPCLVDQAVGCP